MLGILTFLFLVMLILISVKPILKQGHAKLKFLLAFLYIAFIAQCIDAYYSATYADEHYLNGGSTGWFGSWWPFVLLATLAVIVTVHIVLIIDGRRFRDSA